MNLAQALAGYWLDKRRTLSPATITGGDLVPERPVRPTRFLCEPSYGRLSPSRSVTRDFRPANPLGLPRKERTFCG